MPVNPFLMRCTPPSILGGTEPHFACHRGFSAARNSTQNKQERMKPYTHNRFHAFFLIKFIIKSLRNFLTDFNRTCCRR